MTQKLLLTISLFFLSTVSHLTAMNNNEFKNLTSAYTNSRTQEDADCAEWHNFIYNEKQQFFKSPKNKYTKVSSWPSWTDCGFFGVVAAATSYYMKYYSDNSWKSRLLISAGYTGATFFLFKQKFLIV